RAMWPDDLSTRQACSSRAWPPGHLRLLLVESLPSTAQTTPARERRAPDAADRACTLLLLSPFLISNGALAPWLGAEGIVSGASCSTLAIAFAVRRQSQVLSAGACSVPSVVPGSSERSREARAWALRLARRHSAPRTRDCRCSTSS